MDGDIRASVGKICTTCRMKVVCEVCGDIGFECLLLCCSDCKGGHTHQYCLAKVLYDSTLEDWFCNECKERHNKGSNSRSLGKVSSERPSNLSTGQVVSALSLKGVQQPTPVIVNALAYTFGDTGQSHLLKPSEGLAHKLMRTPKSLTKAQAYSTSSLEISSKAKFALEASATDVEISNTVQNLRKDSPKKRRRLIMTSDDEDEEEQKAEDVQQENVSHQPLKCNEYYVEEAVQTGGINDQTHINGRTMKRRRRYIVVNEDEEDIEGGESALNNASKWSPHDSANMASETPVATDHSLQSRPSDSECADRQDHICLQPLDEPVWSGVFKIDNKVCLKLDAHLSNKACQRVHELSGLLQPVVEVRTLSRLQAWPERWMSSGPTDESIGLFFLPHSSIQNEDLSRLKRIIKSDDALQITVGSAELLIFPSVLLPEQYHFFQGKHYLWGVFRQRKDILDNGVQVEEQGGSAHATVEGKHQEHDVLDQQDEALYEVLDKETVAVKHVVDAEDLLQVEGDPEVQNDTMKVATSEGVEGQHQEHNVLDQQDEALYEVLDKETVAVKHVVDGEDQLQVEGDPQVQNDTMKVATSEGVTSLNSSWSPAKLDSSKAGSNSTAQLRTECKLHAPGDAEQQEDITSSPQWDTSSITKQSAAAILAEHGNNEAHPNSEPSTTKIYGFITVQTSRSQQLIQEMVSEGAVLFPVPEQIVTTDSVTASSTGVVSSAVNHDGKCEAPHAFDFVSVGHGEPDVDSEACLELFPVRQEHIGWAPRAEVSGEVDLNLSLGKHLPPAPSSPPLL